MLLIITNKSDITTDYLILELQDRGIPFLRLNTEDYLKKYNISISIYNGNIQARIEYENDSIYDIKQITGVYFHQPLIPNLAGETIECDMQFAERESIEVLRSLWRIIDKKLWVNHPKSLWAANNKIEQLKVASKIGFSIPQTLVSTSKHELLDFYKANNKLVIAKAVKNGFFKHGNKVTIANTKQVKNEDINKIETFANIPMIFQNLIPKKIDIRVTVINNDIFATAIHSQEHNETQIDWRVWDLIDDLDLKHTRYNLPDHLSKKCLDITKSFDLKYSAIDLIETPNNEYYFLELNPNGQWAWIERMVDYPIRSSLIKCLGNNYE